MTRGFRLGVLLLTAALGGCSPNHADALTGPYLLYADAEDTHSYSIVTRATQGGFVVVVSDVTAIAHTDQVILVQTPGEGTSVIDVPRRHVTSHLSAADLIRERHRLGVPDALTLSPLPPLE
ncbi:hypothetical protein [Deinococcus yunweiensis]|uniref:hypothetical protein n=1 Tax=Deinococcus yunweiensis TaxID=367282 RepID=UPI00398F03F0